MTVRTVGDQMMVDETGLFRRYAPGSYLIATIYCPVDNREYTGQIIEIITPRGIERKVPL